MTTFRLRKAEALLVCVLAFGLLVSAAGCDGVSGKRTLRPSARTCIPVEYNNKAAFKLLNPAVIAPVSYTHLTLPTKA